MNYRDIIKFDKFSLLGHNFQRLFLFNVPEFHFFKEILKHSPKIFRNRFLKRPNLDTPVSHIFCIKITAIFFNNSFNIYSNVNNT